MPGLEIVKGPSSVGVYRLAPVPEGSDSEQAKVRLRAAALATGLQGSDAVGLRCHEPLSPKHMDALHANRHTEGLPQRSAGLKMYLENLETAVGLAGPAVSGLRQRPQSAPSQPLPWDALEYRDRSAPTKVICAVNESARSDGPIVNANEKDGGSGAGPTEAPPGRASALRWIRQLLRSTRLFICLSGSGLKYSRSIS